MRVLESHSPTASLLGAIFRICGTTRGHSASAQLLVNFHVANNSGNIACFNYVSFCANPALWLLELNKSLACQIGKCTLRLVI